MKPDLATKHAFDQAAHHQLLTRAALLALLALAVKVAALGKDVCVARTFGTGPELDALLVALAIPLFGWSVVSQTLAAALLPALVAARQREGQAGADGLIRALFCRFILSLLALVAALTLAADQFLPWLGGGFDAEQVALLRRLFFILIWIVPPSGISTYWGAVLNASRILAPPVLAPIAIPTVTLAGLLLTPQLGIEGLAWSIVAGYLAEMLLLAWAMRWRGLPILPRPRGHAQLGPIARQYSCLLFGAVLMSSSTIVDQSMATWLGPGSVSALSYGAKLVAVLLGTLSLGISTAVFPHFSQLVADDDAPGLAQTLAGLTRMVLALTIPLTGLLILLSQPIAQLLFGHGAVTSDAVAEIATIQRCYLLQVPVFILGVIGARLLTALGQAGVLLRISALNLVLNVVGNLVFSRFFGAAGIALSTSCVYLVSTTLVFAALRTRLGKPAPVGSLARQPARAA